MSPVAPTPVALASQGLAQKWCSRWRSAVLRDHQDPQVPYCVAAFQSTSSLHTLVLVPPSGQDFAIPITEADVSFTTVLQIVKVPLASSLTSSILHLVLQLCVMGKLVENTLYLSSCSLIKMLNNVGPSIEFLE